MATPTNPRKYYQPILSHESKSYESPSAPSAYPSDHGSKKVERVLGQTLTTHRKSHNWAAEISDHIRKIRYFLGTYRTSAAASKACLSKLLDFDAQLKDPFGNPKYQPIVESQTETINYSNSVIEVVKEKVENEGSLEGKYTAVIYGNLVDHRKNEEVESFFYPIQTTKRYKGIWRKKSGKWVARIRDPVKNVRVLLGTFETLKEASIAYLSKKFEFEAQLMAASSGKPKNQPIVFNESESESSNKSPNLVVESRILDLPDYSGGGAINGNAVEVVKEQQCRPVSSGEGCNFGLNCGSLIIDNHGFLLGEFSSLDDLRICHIEDEDDAHLIC